PACGCEAQRLHLGITAHPIISRSAEWSPRDTAAGGNTGGCCVAATHVAATQHPLAETTRYADTVTSAGSSTADRKPRLIADTIALSDATEMSPSTPTPQSRASPTWSSTYAAAAASPLAPSVCST